MTKTKRSCDRRSTRKRNCGSCANCVKDNCGNCTNCRDKKEFGGLDRRHKRCVAKKCLAPVSGWIPRPVG